MQPQESPGNMLLFLCHCIVNIRKLNMNVNLNIGFIITNLFNLHYISRFSNSSISIIISQKQLYWFMKIEDLRHQNGRIR